MGYRVLITGQSPIIVNDMFRRAEKSFEVMISSMYLPDLLIHVKYFKPEAIVCYLYEETKTKITDVIEIMSKLTIKGIPVIISGSGSDCSFFYNLNTENNFKIIDNIFDKEEQLKKIVKNYRVQERELQKILDSEIQGEIDDLDLEYEEEIEEGVIVAPDKKILVVDDEIIMLKNIKQILLEDGYHVATAPSGKVALEYLENKTVDLILLDYEMPDMKGPEVLSKLKENPATKDIPVVFLTGTVDRKKIVTALSLKPNGYLLKPISRKQLSEKIKELIG